MADGRRFPLLVLLIAAIPLACGQAVGAGAQGDAASPGVVGDVDVVSSVDVAVDISTTDACDPALTVSPSVATVLPLGMAFLVPGGGTGAYRMLLTDESIGTLNEQTGAFLAGVEGGLSTRVLVTDEGCTGVAEAELRVVTPMAVVPARPEVPPGTAIPFRVEEGSGQVVFELLHNTSGATMAGGDYVAGAVEGVDTITVRDLGTLEEAVVYVDVRSDAQLRPTVNRVHVALGQQFAFGVDGGTGDFSVTATEGLAAFEAGLVTGLGEGDGAIVIEDLISGLSLSVPLEVSTPIGSLANRSGDLQDDAVLLVEDLDGDGHDELLLGVHEMDHAAHDSGAVYLYRGADGGVNTEPARVFSTTDKTVRAGWSIAAGDFDADGHRDLLRGSDL